MWDSELVNELTFFILNFRSQMIGDDDYRFITEFLNSDSAKRDTLLQDQRAQCAKTFLSLLEHISKDQTVQYILTIIDDMLQVKSLLYSHWIFSLTYYVLNAGRQKQGGDYSRIRQKEAWKCLVTFLESFEPTRWFHSEHDISYYREIGVLVTRSHGRLRFDILFDLAERSTSNSG